MLGNKISDQQGTYIVYEPFFDFTFEYQEFQLDECQHLMIENNHLITYKNSNLEQHNIKLYSKLLSHVHTLTDAIYLYNIKSEIIEYITAFLDDKINNTEFKQQMICLITDVNIQIGVELTNFAITWSHYSIIKDVDVHQPEFNGFSKKIKQLFDLCNRNVLNKTFKKEVKLLLREILQYN